MLSYLFAVRDYIKDKFSYLGESIGILPPRDEPVVTNFRRGTNFFGKLGPLAEDPWDVFKHQIEATYLRNNATKVCNTLQKFDISLSDLAMIKRQFQRSMDKGLDPEKGHSDLKMIPTFVTRTPDGSEVGEYLALDLGGTNFRVLLFFMTGSPETKRLRAKEYHINLSIMQSDGKTLFGFISSKIDEFMRIHKMDKKKPRNLGFTFSFPCLQKSLNSGNLMQWTKNFDCQDVVGTDVVQWLQESIEERGLNIKVVALVNDTVGTLMATAFQYPDCSMGMIVGTGTNACYIEEVKNIKNFVNLSSNDRYMIVNMEWGGYGDTDEDCSLDKFTTDFDREIDLGSINPRKQKFEKLISGMYLGEIVRLVLVDLYEKDLFGYKYSNKRTT
ncbi:hypothetical protein ACOME3_004570 [Neoechinorhynchus agilis]